MNKVRCSDWKICATLVAALLSFGKLLRMRFTEQYFFPRQRSVCSLSHTWHMLSPFWFTTLDSSSKLLTLSLFTCRPAVPAHYPDVRVCPGSRVLGPGARPLHPPGGSTCWLPFGPAPPAVPAGTTLGQPNDHAPPGPRVLRTLRSQRRRCHHRRSLSWRLRW